MTLAEGKEGRPLQIKSNLKDNQMYGSCLNLDSNQQEKNFLNNWGNLNMEWVLNDIEELLLVFVIDVIIT